MRSALPLVLLLIGTTASAQTRTSSMTSPFLGGVPAGTAASTPISLTILDAISRGLEHNLGLLTAEDAVGRARGTRWTALSDLLPHVTGRLSESRQLVNLAVFGFPLPEGVPSIVGPFNVFDARLHVSQSIFNLRDLNEARAERHAVTAADYSAKSARDLVVLVTANLYLQSLAAAARVASVQSQRELADAIFTQTSNMKTSGLVAGIDVLRADVELSRARQRETVARSELEKSKLQLARVIGLPAGQPFTLTDELPFVPAPEMNLDQALERAYATRPDYQAALARVRKAEAERAAIVGDALPSVQVDANYGAIGLTPGDARHTYAVIGSVNVPIFNGGRTHGKLLEADAELRTRRAEAADMKAAIDYDVRTAFLDLQSTREQLDVAARTKDLASQTLVQARDRFAAGVASNIDVVQAQQAVADASEQYITALYGYNVSKALLARGLGIAEEAVRQFLGGAR